MKTTDMKTSFKQLVKQTGWLSVTSCLCSLSLHAQINLVINLILLVIGFIVLGRDFGVKTAYVSPSFFTKEITL